MQNGFWHSQENLMAKVCGMTTGWKKFFLKKNEKMPSHVKSNFQEMPPSKIQTKMFINASIILAISVDSKMSDIFVNKNDFVWIIDERF